MTDNSGPTTSDEREHQLDAALARLPRVSLASIQQTPLEAAPRLSEHLGGPPIYIKRDDLTGMACGGNKTRMLEFALADALQAGADTIVCGSAVQSNYCRQMAAACARLGLELHLLLRPERDIDLQEVQGNHLLMHLFGAHVTVLNESDVDVQAEAIAARAAQLEAAGRSVYQPRQDDTVDLDALAYTQMALELVRQCRAQAIDPRFLYVAALDTTQAGIVLGLSWLEQEIQVKAISPYPGVTDRHQILASIANQGATRLGLEIEFGSDDFDNDDSHVGERYGVSTPAGMDAVRTIARTEGLLLDPVYTGKALGALFAHIRSGQLPADAPVIFVHTGGHPALFAYAADVLHEAE
ncbi:MAG: pyridoxal-phosphate dependent enzyme [Gemmatimonadetes bacterium]|nr:pyridoxal-phosphate dependent enzyme [Gemmatimonadota bacterium]MBT7862371.1 pyridoxal-phosphate dependent enzyme [Gemmatimonadota bacterium]